MLKFSIVTPSFRNSNWLKLCVASVADQKEVAFEHIVQDAGSDDGTLDWLVRDPRVKAYVEKDSGMYDAVNRGLKRATGDVLAYLNCDEQYLPGALRSVQDFLEARPEVDVVFAGTVVVDTEGNYICSRKSLVPLKQHIWHRFPVLTSSLFVRRKVVHEQGIYFDTKWRDPGDSFWVMELVKRRVPMAVMNRFTSTFTETGDNMSLGANSLRERKLKQEMTPPWVRRLRPVIILHHRLRCVLAGHFSRKPFSYSLYTLQSPTKRMLREVTRPTPIWRGR